MRGFIFPTGASGHQGDILSKPKPIFYKLHAADFYAIVRELSDKELAKWIRTFSSDLVAGNSKVGFTARMIEEVEIFKKKKSNAGIKGMESRYGKP